VTPSRTIHVTLTEDEARALHDGTPGDTFDSARHKLSVALAPDPYAEANAIAKARREANQDAARAKRGKKTEGRS
jgi:hypothetical protein